MSAEHRRRGTVVSPAASVAGERGAEHRRRGTIVSQAACVAGERRE
jgi:hypothetical protein